MFDGFGYIFSQSVSRLVDQLVIWWAGCLFGWLVGWLVLRNLFSVKN